MNRAGWLASALLSLGLLAHAQSVTNGNFRGARSSAAAPAAAAPKAPEAKAAKVKAYPYHGYLDSVAPDGSWIRLKGKVKARELVISAETAISRDGATVPVADLAPGERVTGTVYRNRDGREEARTVRLKSPE